METPLVTVAQHLGIPERTIRRAADEGLVRGRRASERKFLIPPEEEDYLRRNWDFLSASRAALRTEPNVRLALLFGSKARGTGHPGSDADILVDVSDDSSTRMNQIARRLEDKIDHEIQLVNLKSVESSPQLMVNILEEGRVLVDRDRQWARLRDSLESWRARASDGETLESSLESWIDGS